MENSSRYDDQLFPLEVRPTTTVWQSLNLLQRVALEYEFIANEQNLLRNPDVLRSSGLAKLLPQPLLHLAVHVWDVVHVRCSVRLRQEAFLLQIMYGDEIGNNMSMPQCSVVLTG